MESTKSSVLGILHRMGSATIHQLAEALALSEAAVRRHLDGLRAEGRVDVRLERHAVGRPAFVFYLTERGEEEAAHSYARLLDRLCRGLADLPPADASGRRGSDLLKRLFAGVAERVASEHGSEVVGETLDERVEQAGRALQSEGIVERWDRVDEGFRLVNTVCPYRQAAEASDAPCHSDRLAIELLVGQPVEQVGRVVEGHASCEYVIRAGEPAKARAGGASK